MFPPYLPCIAQILLVGEKGNHLYVVEKIHEFSLRVPLAIISSAISLNLYFWIFPLAVIGNSFTKKMYFGILNLAICPRQ